MALGLCKQSELDAVVQKAADKKVTDGDVMNDDERRKLVSTEKSLEMDVKKEVSNPADSVESFSIDKDGGQDQTDGSQDYRDADSFFNLPDGEPGPEKDN